MTAAGYSQIGQRSLANAGPQRADCGRKRRWHDRRGGRPRGPRADGSHARGLATGVERRHFPVDPRTILYGNNNEVIGYGSLTPDGTMP